MTNIYDEEDGYFTKVNVAKGKKKKIKKYIYIYICIFFL